MPYVESAGARIYWEEHGSGDPVLLIMGMTLTIEMWHRTLPRLARRYRTIVFDNRGVGRSGAPPGSYSIPKMAEDAAAVLDAAGVATAHVIGASMGGMVAQEFALRWPARVRSLVLACTTCGGLRTHLPKLAQFRKPMAGAHTFEERIRGFAPLLYSDSTPRERIEEDNVIRVNHFPEIRAYFKQLAAVLSWSSYGRLPAIHAPALIIHGDSDRILPPRNAGTLARRIPHASKVILPNAGHLFTTDQPELAHEAVMRFLDSVG